MKIEATLSRIPLFQGVNTLQLRSIVNGSHLIKVKRGDTLFQKGDTAEGFYYLIQGTVKLAMIAASGNEKVVDILSEGNTFGEGVMFMNKPYPVYAQATTDAYVVYITRQAITYAIKQDPSFALKMLSKVSSCLYDVLRELETTCLHTSTQRVIGYFINTIPKHLSDLNSFIFTLPATKTMVASQLNLTPETFSRILQNLRNQNLISIQGRNIHIHDISGLQAYGQFEDY